MAAQNEQTYTGQYLGEYSLIWWILHLPARTAGSTQVSCKSWWMQNVVRLPISQISWAQLVSLLLPKKMINYSRTLGRLQHFSLTKGVSNGKYAAWMQVKKPAKVIVVEAKVLFIDTCRSEAEVRSQIFGVDLEPKSKQFASFFVFNERIARRLLHFFNILFATLVQMQNGWLAFVGAIGEIIRTVKLNVATVLDPIDLNSEFVEKFRESDR